MDKDTSDVMQQDIKTQAPIPEEALGAKPEAGNGGLEGTLPHRRDFLKSFIAVAEGLALVSPGVRLFDEQISIFRIESRIATEKNQPKTPEIRGRWPWVFYVHKLSNGSRICVVGVAHVKGLAENHTKDLNHIFKQANLVLLESTDPMYGLKNYFNVLKDKLTESGVRVRMLEDPYKVASYQLAGGVFGALGLYAGGCRIISAARNMISARPFPKFSFWQVTSRALAWFGATFITYPSLPMQLGTLNGKTGKLLNECDPSLISNGRSVSFLSSTHHEAMRKPNQTVVIVCGNHHAKDLKRYLETPEGFSEFEARRKIYRYAYAPFTTMELPAECE